MAGGNSRKIGNKKDQCKAYKAAGTREKNKKLNLKRHIKNNPNDLGIVRNIIGIKLRKEKHCKLHPLDKGPVEALDRL